MLHSRCQVHTPPPHLPDITDNPRHAETAREHGVYQLGGGGGADQASSEGDKGRRAVILSITSTNGTCKLYNYLENEVRCPRRSNKGDSPKTLSINITRRLFPRSFEASWPWRAADHFDILTGAAWVTSTSLDVMYMKPRSVLSTSATPGFWTLITTSSPVFKVAAYTCSKSSQFRKATLVDQTSS